MKPPPRKATPEVQNFLHLLVQHRSQRAIIARLPRSCSQGFTATTGRSAGTRRDGTQRLAVSPPGALPLASRSLAGRSISACLPTFRTQAADRARATCTPGTAWPVNGYPPGSSRDSFHYPGSDAICLVSTLQRWFTRVRLPGPRLTALTLPFPHRSARQSSASAPCGGLVPPPAGRHRGAMNPHLACSTHIQSSPPTRRLLSVLVAQGNSG